jgi:hypothetical protein
MEHAMNVQLAAHWRDPRQPRPHPNIPRTFPFRLVPAAAALATAQLADPDREALDELQGKAVDYFGSINRPDKLAGADDRRRVYLRSLAQRLDFARAPRTPEDEP